MIPPYGIRQVNVLSLRSLIRQGSRQRMPQLSGLRALSGCRCLLLAIGCWLMPISTGIGAEQSGYSLGFLQSVIKWGYDRQRAHITGAEETPASRETLRHSGQDVVSHEDFRLPETEALLQLFDPAVREKTPAIAAWKNVTIREHPSSRILIDKRRILGFPAEWSVLIGVGSIQEVMTDGFKTVVCDEIVSGRYRTTGLPDDGLMQFSLAESSFLVARKFSGIAKSGFDSLAGQRLEVPPVDVRGLEGAAGQSWRILSLRSMLRSCPAPTGDLSDEYFRCVRWDVGGIAFGVHVDGCHYLARADSAVNAFMVTKLGDAYQRIFLATRCRNARWGLAGLIRTALDAKGDPWDSYIGHLLAAIRRAPECAPGGGFAGRPLSFLDACDDRRLGRIMADAMTGQFEDILVRSEKDIDRHNERLTEMELASAFVSLRQILPNRARPFLEEARHKSHRGDWDGAMRTLLSAVEEVEVAPERGKLRFAIFNLSQAKPDPRSMTADEKTAALREVVALDPESPAPAIRLANLHAHSGRLDQGLDVLRRALEVVPSANRPEILREMEKLQMVVP